MPRVVVPIRYPPNDRSLATLRQAVRIAHEEGAELTILHVEQFHNNSNVTRRQLERACKHHAVGSENVNYIVRRGHLVEETILNEIEAEESDIAVIGKAQAGRWRRMSRRLRADPNIELFLQDELDCDLITVSAD